jgi:hypothetical protein
MHRSCTRTRLGFRPQLEQSEPRLLLSTGALAQAEVARLEDVGQIAGWRMYLSRAGSSGPDISKVHQPIYHKIYSTVVTNDTGATFQVVFPFNRKIFNADDRPGRIGGGIYNETSGGNALLPPGGRIVLITNIREFIVPVRFTEVAEYVHDDDETFETRADRWVETKVEGRYRYDYKKDFYVSFDSKGTANAWVAAALASSSAEDVIQVTPGNIGITYTWDTSR